MSDAQNLFEMSMKLLEEMAGFCGYRSKTILPGETQAMTAERDVFSNENKRVIFCSLDCHDAWVARRVKEME